MTVAMGLGPTSGSDDITELRAAALHAWQLVEADDKTAWVLALAPRAGTLPIDAGQAWPDLEVPGRPARPPLVAPKQLARRSMATLEGRAILLHALAHIEFNAVNLALDAVWRFTAMPELYYRQWWQIAVEEATHFRLLQERMRAYGANYGDYPAHDSLWELAWRTRHHILDRMALVPRTMEARGLDVSPAIRDKLLQVGDTESAAVLSIILRDEIGHVAVGNHWFHWLCRREACDPITCYAELATQHRAPALRRPYNLEARLAAGFEEQELAAMAAMGKGPVDQPV